MFTRETCLCKGLVCSCVTPAASKEIRIIFTHFTSMNLSETYGKKYILTCDQITPKQLLGIYVVFGCFPINMLQQMSMCSNK